MTYGIGNALDPGELRILRIGVEPAVALQRCALLQLIRDESLGFRNQSQQRQVEIPVLDHIEVGPCTHGCPVNFDVSDAAVRKEPPDILAEE